MTKHKHLDLEVKAVIQAELDKGTFFKETGLLNVRIIFRWYSEIIGIQEDKIDKICNRFITTINNESKMYPPLYLNPVDYERNGKRILYIRVPVSQESCAAARSH